MIANNESFNQTMRLSSANVLTATAVLLPPVAIIVPLGVAPLLAVTLLGIVASRLCHRDGFDVFRGIPAVLLGLFLLWAAISLFWTPEFLRGTRTVAKLALLFGGGILAINSAQNLMPEERDRCGKALLIGVTAALLYLAIDIYGHGIIRGAFLKALGEGGYQPSMLNRPVSIVVLLLWPALIVVRNRFPGRSVWLCLLAAVGLLAGAESATALVGLLAGATVMLIFSIPKCATAIRSLVTVGAMVSVLALPLFTGTSDKIETWRSTGTANSLMHRLYIWDFTATRALERPVNGWGMESSRSLAKKQTEIIEQRPGESVVEVRKRFFRSASLPLHPHNAGLQVWVELGAIGALLLAGILGWLCWTAGDRRKWPLGSGPMLGLVITGFAIASSGFGIWQSWWMSSLWMSVILTMAVVPAAAGQTMAEK